MGKAKVRLIPVGLRARRAENSGLEKPHVEFKSRVSPVSFTASPWRPLASRPTTRIELPAPDACQLLHQSVFLAIVELARQVMRRGAQIDVAGDDAAIDEIIRFLDFRIVQTRSSKPAVCVRRCRSTT